MLTKRILPGVISIILGLMLIPCTFATAAEVVPADDSKELHITDYMEFYNNQSEYYSLAKQGYRILIDVPDEYEDLEESRLNNLASNTQKDLLVPAMARGTSWPTRTHDVIKDGMYFFEGSTSNYPLYTNYAFVGDYAYFANFHNRSSTYTLGLV